jgi:hypothetical protein
VVLKLPPDLAVRNVYVADELRELAINIREEVVQNQRDFGAAPENKVSDLPTRSVL